MKRVICHVCCCLLLGTGLVGRAIVVIEPIRALQELVGSKRQLAFVINVGSVSKRCARIDYRLTRISVWVEEPCYIQSRYLIAPSAICIYSPAVLDKRHHHARSVSPNVRFLIPAPILGIPRHQLKHRTSPDALCHIRKVKLGVIREQDRRGQLIMGVVIVLNALKARYAQQVLALGIYGCPTSLNLLNGVLPYHVEVTLLNYIAPRCLVIEVWERYLHEIRAIRLKLS